MIKCILFDMGGVILSNNIETIVRKLSEEFAIPSDTILEIRKNYKEALWDGKMSVRNIVETIKEKYSMEQSIDEILAKWKETYLRINNPNAEALELVKKLKKKYKVGLISNLWDFHIEINRERGIFNHFNPCLLSCELKMHKPQKEIFDLAVKKSKVKGNECVFIDDRKEYFEVAQSTGMKTIEFKSVEQLIADLQKLGVVVE